MTQTLAIVGPTGTGKTELSLGLAELLRGEIVNCDSRQIYRGLDIGSAKPTLVERERVPHHLFDLIAPSETFDCARYRSMARAAIDEIGGRDKRSILVGGTGLYLKTVRYGLFEGPPRDEALRSELTAREAADRGCLHAELTAADPPTAARLHPNDTHRVVRALEVQKLSGRPLSSWHAEHGFRQSEISVRVFGLSMPREKLYERIDQRCREMVERGFVEEVRGLLDAGLSADLPALRSIGYREIGDYLRGRCQLDDAIEAMARATRRFAKRQLTWFRADPTIEWVEAISAKAEVLAQRANDGPTP